MINLENNGVSQSSALAPISNSNANQLFPLLLSGNQGQH